MRMSFCRLGLVGVLLLGLLTSSFGEDAISSILNKNQNWKQEAYVWQKDWNAEVGRSVREKSGSFAGFTVLALEISWKKGRLTFEPVGIDRGLLKGIKTPIKLAVRINAIPQCLGYHAGTDAEMLLRLTEWWKRSGVGRELQIDFDCPESKLEGYSQWIKELRARLHEVRLTITALPSWLRQDAFSTLARTTDGYVLQVHSLERPTTFEAVDRLCDPMVAMKSVELAGKVGVPFMIALPTYSYLLAYSVDGKFIGLSAEGPRVEWPYQTRLKVVQSEDKEIAGLMQNWLRTVPRNCGGVIWYRLPMRGEVFNWSWPTLQSVMEGRIPKADIAIELRHPEARLVEIDLRNNGDGDGFFAQKLVLRAKGAKMVGGDGLQGYEAVEMAADAWELRRKNNDRLRPGERRMVGWVRLDKDVEVTVELVKN